MSSAGKFKPPNAQARISRRTLLGSATTTIAVAIGGASCRKKPLVCNRVDGLSPGDVQLRTTLEYADTSPQPDRACDVCTLYVAATEEGSCGSCKVVQGPIHPKGTCKVFLRKPEGGAPT